MKVFRYILLFLALGLIVFNATKLNPDALFEGESQIALIGILASACTAMLILILQVSFAIREKRKKQ